MRTPTYAFLSVVVVAGAILANACSSPPASIGLSQGDQTSTDPTNTPTTGGSKPPASTPAPATPATPAAPAAPAANPSTADGGAVVVPDGGVPAADASPPLPGQQDCSATTTADTCGQCCDANNAAGIQVADDAWMACICQTPGACAQVCGADLCAGQDPSAQCQQCLDSQQAQPCDDAAQTACDANPACQAADQCYQDSACDTKQ